jgi:hypothetical protein
MYMLVPHENLYLTTTVEQPISDMSSDVAILKNVLPPLFTLSSLMVSTDCICQVYREVQGIVNATTWS